MSEILLATKTHILASGPPSEVPDVIQTEAQRIALKLAAEIFRPMLIQAIFVVVAIIVTALIFLREKKKEERAQETPASDDED
jgi:hypothetical protein